MKLRVSCKIRKIHLECSRAFNNSEALKEMIDKIQKNKGNNTNCT